MLKTTQTKVSTVTIRSIREAMVTDLYIAYAAKVKSGQITREQFVGAMSPMQDSLHTGPKESGHSDARDAIIGENLDSFMETIHEDQDA